MRGNRLRNSQGKGDILTTNIAFDWKKDALAKVRGESTALLVIDVQYDFCSPTGALAGFGSDVGPSEEVARRIEQFLPEVRGFVSFVGFFRLIYDLGDQAASAAEG